MLCFFFFYVSVYTRKCRNNASISNFGGGFRYQNESSWCIDEEFSTKSIFLYGCNSKTNHYKYLKFSPNVYVMSIKKNLDDQKFKFLRNLSKTRKFARLKIQN
ncbi:Uncharacterized protein FWK35_00033576, partial [Aphis craccivora]